MSKDVKVVKVWNEYTPNPVLPPEVEALLQSKERLADLTLANMCQTESVFECERRMSELRKRRLLPPQLRVQVYESYARKNTPRQMMNVVHFLSNHQLVILYGEKLPPLNSPFCRVPFSNTD